MVPEKTMGTRSSGCAASADAGPAADGARDTLAVDQFVYPIFVTAGEHQRSEIRSMPGSTAGRWTGCRNWWSRS